MNDPDKSPLSFWQVLLSVLAAAFGVQSGKNRQRDFSRGRPLHFVVIGLLATALFVLLLYGTVQLVLHFATD
ncbi:hypothetical protein HNP49_003293 [Pseudomonas fluvialis]|uniref:DUF2970 domain-containing protein n=1 Tax=Pseudomonas fluvialis TaxID=1793966 RepID=A0A7X0BUK8_9PSED|nr:DUF2970 domain-containing protein [Pseudomonas fluvialis]MBB6343105.1 hypothetical protein [Pseudomonas fluvialis]